MADSGGSSATLVGGPTEVRLDVDAEERLDIGELRLAASRDAGLDAGRLDWLFGGASYDGVSLRGATPGSPSSGVFGGGMTVCREVNLLASAPLGQ